MFGVRCSTFHAVGARPPPGDRRVDGVARPRARPSPNGDSAPTTVRRSRRACGRELPRRCVASRLELAGLTCAGVVLHEAGKSRRTACRSAVTLSHTCTGVRQGSRATKRELARLPRRNAARSREIPAHKSETVGRWVSFEFTVRVCFAMECGSLLPPCPAELAPP